MHSMNAKLALGTACLLMACLAASAAEQEPVRVLMDTELGEVEVEVDVQHAPVTARNFLKYVDGGHYNGGHFFRTVTMDNQPDDKVRIEVVQASVNEENKEESFPPIPLERTSETRLSHKNGVISMARGEPDSATSSFFFCIGDQPELDVGGRRNPDGQGFGAFGRVVRGMDVVREIQKSPAQGQRLTPPIRIQSVRRVGS